MKLSDFVVVLIHPGNMKVKVTTLTGDKHELEVAPQDTVRNLKKLLYLSGKVTSQVRLLQGQTLLEDDRKLCEYSLPEGTTISALFEPDVNINIEVSMGNQTQKLTVSNTTSIMGLKAQINGVMRCGVTPEKLEIRLGDVTLKDAMPLHFYRIYDGSLLHIIKPYLNIAVENNYGGKLYWRLKRKDTIHEVKVKLAQSMRHMKFDVKYNEFGYIDQIKGFQDGGVEGMRLFVISKEKNFDELDDDETVANCNVKDGDKLYLLTYWWLHDEIDVTVLTTNTIVQGVEPDETCLGIKVKVQDQTGLPANALHLKHDFDNSFDIRSLVARGGFMSDEQKPSVINKKAPLVVITEEEYLTEHYRMVEEMKSQQQQ